MDSAKQNLLGMSEPELTAFAEGIGIERYRGGQIFGWLYTRGADTFRSMTDLGKELRERLEMSACIEGITPVMQQVSPRDGTTKFLFSLSDNLNIETVLIPPSSAFMGREAAMEDEQRRLTLCVSTQVGCPLDCIFCATGTMGFSRNLTSGEIIDQIRQVRRLTERKITNIVFMGMGEPLLNYENLMRATEIITGGLGIAARRITVSTAGWIEGIKKMAEEKRRVKLAISLHSAVEETRASLMPVTRHFSLEGLSLALDAYYRRTKQRITYEFIFFDGINDSDREVAQLIKFARRVPCKINVIPFHSIAFAGLSGLAASLRPSPYTEEIVTRLRAAHLTVMVRSSAGEDIAAACGQLAVVSRRGGRDLRRPGGTVRHEAQDFNPL